MFALRDLSVYQNIITRWKLVTHENKKGDNGEFMDAEISAGNLVNVQLQVKIFQKTDPIPKLVCYQDHASQSCLANTYHSISRISYNFFSLAFVNSDHNSGLNLNGTL